MLVTFNVSSFCALPSLFTALLVFVAPLQDAAAADCTQTLSTGSNLVSAVSNAPSGSTICLNAGNYGAVTFSNIKRTSMVTVRSTSGISAQLSPTISSSSNIRLESLTLSNAKIENCSTYIQIAKSTWVPDTSGISIYDHGYNCSTAHKQILIDGNNFSNTRPAWSEGKIGVVGVTGITFSNNLIQGQSTGFGGDGIQFGGSNNSITVGPGNIFRNIRQAPCDATPGVPHCDAIQIVGGGTSWVITQNWFDNVEVPLQHHDGTAAIQFTHNLITHGAQFWAYGPEVNNAVFEHNTFYDQKMIFMGVNGSGVSTSTGLIVRSNIFLQGDSPNICSGCTSSFNLGNTSGQAPGSNPIIGIPTFVGGTPSAITQWFGWQLAASSLGKSNAHDGQDRGTLFFGSPASSSPSVPQNLRVVTN